MSNLHINRGDTVILIEANQVKLQSYVGLIWHVEAVMPNSFPESVLISRGDIQASTYVKNLEVVPPSDSPFKHGEIVRIHNPFIKINYMTCDKSLVGKTGKIKNYDSKIDFYCIGCQSGETGWFPPSSLIPINFKGEYFYYPMQQVKYKDKIVVIDQTKKTKFNFGQLLLIDGAWVPSTDVEKT